MAEAFITIEVTNLQGKRYKFNDIPLSLTGKALQELISGWLPFKPGSYISLQHGSVPLSFDQTLLEQGIGCEVNEVNEVNEFNEVNEVTLTSVYLPVKIQSAWSYLRDHHTDMSSLQGLTQLEGIGSLLHLRNLPHSVKSLTLSHHFNRSLQLINLPNGLHTLTFGVEFNRSLDGLNLPRGLRRLTFGYCFD